MPNFDTRSLKDRVRTFALIAFLPLASLPAAPGDFTVEIIARTGDSNSGPNQQAFNEISYGAYLGGGHPVSIDDRGYVTFAADSGTGDLHRSGIYQFTDQLRALAESQASAPGVTKNGEPTPFKSIPWRAYTSSPDGKLYAFTSYVDTGTYNYLYSATDQAIDAAPITYPEYLGTSIQPTGRFLVSDGRGTENELTLGGSVGVLAINNRGDIVWKHGSNFLRTQRQASGASPIAALAYPGTTAPGFPENENATIGTLRDLLGLDAAGNAYFIATVNGATLNNRHAIYRLAADSPDLTLVYASGIHTLPEWDDTSTLNFDADDIYPMEDGTVILRLGTTGSLTGFWKAKPDGTFENAGLFAEFAATPTDQGDLGFRSMRVDFSDYAVADNGAIFFTADVRFGASGNNQEGVWMIDPADNSIKTIARAETDAPGTDAQFGPISAISADGPGYVAFISKLSDGNDGLFLTNRNSQVVAIAIEGQAMDGSTITEIHFTPDSAGQDLGDTHAAAGLNAYGDLVFTADLANGSTAIVRAAYEREKPPEGNVYKWNGKTNGIEWHEVVDQLSNWEDAAGTRWNTWPNGSSAEAIIQAPHFVQLVDTSVTLSRIDSTGTLELLKNLTILNDAKLADTSLTANAKLTLQGSLQFDGTLASEKDGLTYRPSSPESTFSTAGSITADQRGIDAQSPATLELENQADVTSTNGTAINASSENGDVIIENTGSLIARNGQGLVASAPNGSVFINSPSSTSATQTNITGGSGSGIYANAKDAVLIHFNGEAVSGSTAQNDNPASIRANSVEGSVNIDSKGHIDAVGTISGRGLLGTAQNGVSIKHQGLVTTSSTAVSGTSEQSNVTIDMTNAVIQSYGGIYATTPAGSIYIKSGQIDSNNGNGINAVANQNIDILARGPIEQIGGIAAVYAESAAGNITVDSNSNITSTGSTTSGRGYRIVAHGDVDITQSQGHLSLSSTAFWIESTNGNITVDAQNATIDANRRGYLLEAPEGSIELKSGETNAGDSDAIETIAKNDIHIYHKGEINTGGASSTLVSGYGISAESSAGAAEIDSHGNISTTHNGPSPAIRAKGFENVYVRSSGNLSTFRGSPIRAESANGSVEIVHDGYLTASDRGTGVWAAAEKGSIFIDLKNGAIDARNESSDTIHYYGVAAFADQSVSIVSNSSINTFGTNMAALHAESATAGVSVLLNAEISPNGPSSDGVSLSSPTAQTLTLAGGSITATDGSAAAVRFLTGNANTFTNRGSVDALSMLAVKGDTGNESIHNFGSISGDILLGEGNNTFTNKNKAFAYPENEVEVGADNTFTNEGTLVVGNDSAESTSLAITGNFTQTASGATQLDIQSGILRDRIDVSQTATLDGSLILHAAADLVLTAPLELDLLSAAALSGTFSRAIPTTVQEIDPSAVRAYASQNPSRTLAATLDYTDTDVVLTLSPITIESYGDWESLYFTDPSTQETGYNLPFADSDQTADPDNDGLSNLEEYVYGTHPLLASASPVDFTPGPNGISHFSFNWAKDVTDYQWQIESSANLVDWSPQNIALAKTTDLGELVRHHFEFPGESLPKFIRVTPVPVSN